MSTEHVQLLFNTYRFGLSFYRFHSHLDGGIVVVSCGVRRSVGVFDFFHFSLVPGPIVEVAALSRINGLGLGRAKLLV